MFDVKTFSFTQYGLSDSISSFGGYFTNLTDFSRISDIRDDGFMTSHHEPQEPLDEFMANFT